MPLADEDVVAAFGDPAAYLLEDGGISPFWERRILGTIPLPAPLPLSWDRGRRVTGIRCHRLIAPFMMAAFEAVWNNPEAWADLDDFAGCYAWRPRRGNPHGLSRHGWGIAVDVDAVHNPYGVKPHMHPITVQAFEAQGFEWGGRWPVPDGMHFEFVDLKRLAVAV